MAKQMMLIEDEDDLRTLLEEYLQDHGLTVISFGSADKALPYWEAHRDEVDLVLTDMRMPGTIDGIGLAREIRSHTDSRQPSIVMISGFEPPPRVMLEQLKINDFISKPFRISELSRLCEVRITQPPTVQASSNSSK
jgi:DNA-binding response OmpR family regulator